MQTMGYDINYHKFSTMVKIKMSFFKFNMSYVFCYVKVSDLDESYFLML
jgi:hypothetical protein